MTVMMFNISFCSLMYFITTSVGSAVSAISQGLLADMAWYGDERGGWLVVRVVSDRCSNTCSSSRIVALCYIVRAVLHLLTLSCIISLLLLLLSVTCLSICLLFHVGAYVLVFRHC